MDGRDVSPTSGIEYVKQLLLQIDEIGVGKIATLCGRYYAMDRDNRWERIEQCYNAMVNGIARKTHKSIRAIRSYSLTSVLTVQEKLHVLWQTLTLTILHAQKGLCL